MELVTKKYLNEEVLSLQAIGNTLLAGIGGSLFVYKDNTLQCVVPIFQDQKIHIIKIHLNNLVLVVGGKRWAICHLDDRFQCTVTRDFMCEDWILDIVSNVDRKIVLVTAHNQCQTWTSEKNGTFLLESVSSCEDRCILYSSTLYITTSGTLLVFAGTVYSEIIIWKPCLESVNGASVILHRLTGHKGVIFSIAVEELNENNHVICSSSDDRSIRIWSVQGRWEDAAITESQPLFGHSARVWKCLLTTDFVVSIGEDSLLCLWNYDGRLISKIALHQSGGIRAISYTEHNRMLTSAGSDGGILQSCIDDLADFNLSNVKVLSIPLEKTEIPRKVKFFFSHKSMCLTSRGRIFDETGQVIVFDEQNLRQCTDLEISNCGRYIAVSTVKGRILIFDGAFNNSKIFECDIGEGKLCQSIKWRDNHILVNIQDGLLVLLYVDETMHPTRSGSFVLPRSRERSATCFMILKNTLLVGDRVGNLHVYNREQEIPIQTLKKLHSCLGISDILYWTEKDSILTAGAGGWVREIELNKNGYQTVRSYAVSVETASRLLIIKNRVLILGFLGADFKVWDLSTKTTIACLNCGGNHRSWDFRLKNDNLEFIFIKNKLVNHASIMLLRGHYIRQSYHFRTINCLEALGTYLFVSGSEDNTMRISRFDGNDIETLFTFDDHISSIRAISICNLSEEFTLIMSGGGREQLSLTEYNRNNQKCRQILSHFSGDAPIEGRFMCIETLILSDGRIIIVVGCSDCSLRLFTYNRLEEKLDPIKNLQYNRCILHVTIVTHGIHVFVVSFATDGSVVFWNISQVLDGKDVSVDHVRYELHSSGINSFAVKKMTTNDLIIATGGDDNVLMVSLFIFCENKRFWSMASSISTCSAHCAQITGIMFIDNILLSTGIDQRLMIHRVANKQKSLSLQLVSKTMTTVHDTHGITLLDTLKNLTVSIFGKGLEIFEIDSNVIYLKE